MILIERLRRKGSPKNRERLKRCISIISISLMLSGTFLPITTQTVQAAELIPYKYWGVSIGAVLSVRPSGGSTVMELIPGRNLKPSSGSNFFDDNLFNTTLDGILTSDANIPREYELTDNSFLTYETFRNQANQGIIKELENKSISDWKNDNSLARIGTYSGRSTGLGFDITGQAGSNSFYVDIRIPSKSTMLSAPYQDRNGTSDGSDRRYDTTITFVLRAKHEKWNEELGEWDIDSKVEAKLSMSEYSPARWNYKDFDHGFSADYAVRMDASGSTSARPKVTYTYDAGVDNKGNVDYAGEESSSQNIYNYNSSIYPNELSGKVYQNGNFKVGGAVEVEDDRGESKFAYANTNVNYQVYNNAPNALSAFTDKDTGSSKYLYAQRPVAIKDTSTDPENELMDVSYKLYDGATQIAHWELTRDLISSPFRIKNENFNSDYIAAMDITSDTKTTDITFVKDGNYKLEQITGDIRNHSIVSQQFSSRTYTLNIRKAAAPPVADFEYRLHGRPTDFTYPNVAVALLDKSTDPNDDITNWLWTRYNNTTANTQEGVTAVFPAEGIYSTTLKVTDFLGLSDSITKSIEVLPPIPKAEITTNEAESLMKENRKIILSAEDSFAPPGDPIQWEKTIWEITPLDGQDPQSMKTLTSQSSGKKKTMVFKETGQYKVDIELFNNFTIANPDHPRIDLKKKTIIIDIKEDKNPIAEFAVTGNSPNFKDNPASTIAKVENTSLSEDSDFFDEFPTPAGDNDYYGRGADSFLWEIRKDSNEDNVFDENEVYGKFSGREIDIPVSYKENEGTEYQAKLISKETFGQPTVVEFVSDTDRRTTTLTKNFNINWIPDIKFELPEWAYPINLDDENDQPNTTITTVITDERVNTTKVIWSLESKDLDGEWKDVDISNETINSLTNDGGGIAFKKSGNYRLTSTVTDEKGQTSSYSEEIRIYPLPTAIITDALAWDNTNNPAPFNTKQNRKYSLSGSSSHINDKHGEGIHQINHDKDYWEILPMDEQGLQSIRVAQGMTEITSEDAMIFKTTNRRLANDMLFKAKGEFLVRYQVTNSIGKKSNFTEQSITVHQDQNPILSYKMSDIIYRQPVEGDTAKATVLAYDIKIQSPDRDNISLEQAEYRFDTNNNGSFEDETLQPAGPIDKTDESNWKVEVSTTHVGKYEIKILAEESYGQPTIDAFVDKTGTDKRHVTLKDGTEVDNIAPLADLDGFSSGGNVEILVTREKRSSFSKEDIYEWGNSTLKSEFAKSNIKSDISFIEYGGLKIPISRISSTDYHTIIIGSDGNAYTTGRNIEGQLGLGDNTDRNTFTKVSLPSGVNAEQVITGHSHTIIIGSDGNVYATGLGDNTDRNTFTKVSLPSGVNAEQVVAGNAHTIIIGSDGNAYATGRNHEGQLGLGDNTNRNTFTKVSLPSGINAEQVIVGGYHTIIIGSDGNTYATGHNIEGQLSLGDNTNRNTFTKVSLPSGINAEQVIAGHYHTIIIGSDGNLYATGNNQYGGLGLGDNTNRNTFTKIPLPSGVNAEHVSAGYHHTIIIGSDGNAYGTGRNIEGQLGLGDNTDRNTFTRVTLQGEGKAEHVSAGYSHTIIIGTDGNLYATGNNEYGQLGLGNNSNRNTFTKIPLPSGINAEQVIVGDYHTIIIGSDGNAYTTGYNKYGQLGLGDDTDRNTFTKIPLPSGVNAEQVTAGTYHTIIIGSDGNAYATGDNSHGQLGLGDNTGRNTFTKVALPSGVNAEHVSAGFQHSLIIGSDGNAYATGRNINGQLGLGDNTNRNTFTKIPLPSGINAEQVIAGGHHTIIIGSDGNAYTTGYNHHSQLGLGDNTNRNTFTKTIVPGEIKVRQEKGEEPITLYKVISQHKWADDKQKFVINIDDIGKSLDENKTQLINVLTTNNINYVHVGDSQEKANVQEFINSLPTKGLFVDNKVSLSDISTTVIGFIETIISKSAEKLVDLLITRHSDSKFSKADILNWMNGDLKTKLAKSNIKSDISFIEYGGLKTHISRISSGHYHTIIIGSDGNAYVTGYNYDGQLGLGDYTNRNTFTKIPLPGGVNAEHVSAGYGHTIIIGSDGNAYATGLNQYGELGLGNYTNRNTFTKIPLPSGVNAEQVIAGRHHTVIIGSDGNAYATGRNFEGQLGLGDNTTRNTFTKVSLPSGVNAEQVIAGHYHTIIIGSDGNLYATGNNQHGGLGLGDNTNRNTFTKIPPPSGVNTEQVIAGAYHTIIIGSDGNAYATGRNFEGQLGLGDNTTRNTFTKIPLPSGVNAEQVIAGLYHTIIIGSDGNAYATGRNFEGQLGLGDNTNRNTLTKIPLPSGVNAEQVIAGDYHTIIIGSDGNTYATGYNPYGQLGLGDNTNRNTFTKVTLQVEGKAEQISSMGHHTIIIGLDGNAYATGQNAQGQLGLGDNTTRNTFTKISLPSGVNAEQVIAGFDHSLILGSDGNAYGTGRNIEGQLGLGNNTNRNTFTKIPLPSGVNVEQVSAGYYHTIIIGSDGNAYATGYNLYGQLGLGNNSNRNTFTKIPLPSGVNAEQVIAGAHYTLIVGSDGNIYAAGSNDYGQLGLGDYTNRNTFTKVSLPGGIKPVQVDTKYLHSLIIGSDGNAYATGYNREWQLGLGDNTNRNTFTKVSLPSGVNAEHVLAGYDNSLIIGSDGNAYGTGRNIEGQLGLGDNTNKNAFTKIPLPGGVNAEHVSAGYYHTIIIGSDGNAYATGYNREWQLGLGDNTNRNTFTKTIVPGEIKVSQEKGEEPITLYKVISQHKWVDNAQKYIISFDDEMSISDKENLPDITAALNDKKIGYIGISNPSHEAATINLTESLTQEGTFINNNQTLDKIGDDIRDYLISIFDALKTNSKYILLGDMLEYIINYSDYENDPQYDIHQWKYEHNPNHFENPLGEITEAEDGYSNSSFKVFKNNFKTGTSTGGINKFSKTGRYLIGYRTKDNPVGTDDRFDNYRKWSTMPNGPMEVFVHRKPLADFTFRINKYGANMTVTADSKAYDLDHESEPKKGIVKKEWYYKDINASTWTLLNGTESVTFSGETTKDYFLKHRVRDIDGPDGLGEWSEEIKLITTKPLPPTAKFDITPKIYQVRSGQIIKVQDKSTDPNDDPLVEYRWNLTKTEIPRYNKTLTNPSGATQSQVDAVANDIQNTIEGMGHAAYGIWTLELQVRDNTGEWGNGLTTSNIYKQNFEVIPNNQPPSATIDPTNVFVDGRNDSDTDEIANPMNNYIDWKSIVSDADPDNKGFVYKWELEHHANPDSTIAKSTQSMTEQDKITTKIYTTSTPFLNKSYLSQLLPAGPYKIRLSVTDLPMYGEPVTVTTESTNYIVPVITAVPEVIPQDGKEEIIVGDTVRVRVETDEFTTEVKAKALTEEVSLSYTGISNDKHIWESQLTIPEVEESGEMDIEFKLTTDYGSQDVFGVSGQVTRTKTIIEKVNVTALKLIDFRITDMKNNPDYYGLYPLTRSDFLLNYIAGYYVTFQIDSKGNPDKVYAYAEIDSNASSSLIDMKKTGLNTWEGKYFAPYDTPGSSIISFKLMAEKGPSSYNYNEKESWNGETLRVVGSVLEDVWVNRTN